jgi:hypothetical protein
VESVTQEELEADYYVSGYLSAKDGADTVVWDDIPLKIAVVGCIQRATGHGVCLTFENEADGTISSVAMTQSEALRLVGKVLERIIDQRQLASR